MECSICLEPLDTSLENHKLCTLKCQHHFHTDCIVEYILSENPQVCCPLCRSEIHIDIPALEHINDLARNVIESQAQEDQEVSQASIEESFEMEVPENPQEDIFEYTSMLSLCLTIYFILLGTFLVHLCVRFLDILVGL